MPTPLLVPDKARGAPPPWAPGRGGGVALSALVRKFARYAAVSGVATATSLTVLGALVATRALGASWANVLAVAVGTVPSFELNRRWVWGKRGERSLLTEVVPFCVLSLAGLCLSTLTVGAAAAWATRASLQGGARTLVVEGAHMAAFGSLWVVQYVVLDRVLFRRSPLLELNQARLGPLVQR